MTVATLDAALAAGLRRVDELADRSFARRRIPGLVYGVIVGGELVHARGLGTLRVGESAPPRADSVFRIASMTKSFTAAIVLLLRDDGLLRLDDPVERYVPELEGLAYPTGDSPRITIRHLLTMTAGFPTDDPWGDRQQSLDLEAFSELLRGGLSFAWAPGTRYAYSNVGYGILGRLITNVTGTEYKDVVHERLLVPLGMSSTSYLEADFDPTRVARGYLWRDGQFIDEPSDGYGALAAMGGLFTTVADLARWVAGFTDAFPPRDGPDVGHPLSRATRREMQQPMVASELQAGHASADAVTEVASEHYGFGLSVGDDIRFGRIVGHGGGYPGYGSHMRWHPESGLGIVALTNHRYGPAMPLARDMMAELLRTEAVPVRPVRPSAATLAARAAVERLIGAWDDQLAAETFAMNVDLDEPLASRRAALERLGERHGALRPDDSEPTQSFTPFHLAWWLAGERGRIKVELLLSPEVPPRVQTFAVTSVPEPPVQLRRAAERIVASLTAPERGPLTIDWPADLVVTDRVDLGLVVRAMRAAEARFAPLELGPVVDGDGERKATFRLGGPRGQVDLALELDLEAGCLDTVSLVPVRLTAPGLD
jgi:serine-type D-Ala-D-Ala carboxypeptidase/endopeptidase